MYREEHDMKMGKARYVAGSVAQCLSDTLYGHSAVKLQLKTDVLPSDEEIEEQNCKPAWLTA